MAAIALVDIGAFDLTACELLGVLDDGCQGMAVVDPMGSGWRPADWQNEVA